jgi:hypothetical protein
LKEFLVDRVKILDYIVEVPEKTRLENRVKKHACLA